MAEDPLAPAAPRPDDDDNNNDESHRRRREEELEELLLQQEEEELNEDVHSPTHDNIDDDDNADPLQENPPPPLQPPGEFRQPALQPLKRWSYPQISFAIALWSLWYALRTRRQQWYLAIVFLNSSRWACAVWGNACLAMAVTLFETTVRWFLQGLRLAEAEGLQDFFRWNVTETCIALTMFRHELNVFVALQFLGVIMLKCLHHVAKLRGQHYRQQDGVESLYGGMLATVPIPHMRLCALLVVLQFADLVALQYSVSRIVKTGPSVQILLALEAAIMLVSAWSGLLHWNLHVMDGTLHHLHEQAQIQMLHVWNEYKATLNFAVELQAQAIQFLAYTIFFGIVLTYYGLPINLIREVYMSFQQLKERLMSFMKYRRLMLQLNEFPDVSEEQLEEAGDICIICRDPMRTSNCKALPSCGHIFHKSCLREWLVQQQSCPTCRSDILSGAAAARRAEAAAEVNPADPPPDVEERENVDQVLLDEGQQDRVRPRDEPHADTEAVDEPKTNTYPVSHADEQDSNSTTRASPSTHGATAVQDHAFPALYDVVSLTGASVYSTVDEDQVVRIVPRNVIVLATERSEGKEKSLMLRIPDGWIRLEHVVLLAEVPREFL